ncbi:MAG: hypothetical protein ACRDHX_16040 [Chloroflexota bacterium]
MIRPVRYRDLAAIGSIHRVSHAIRDEWQTSAVPRAWPSTQATLLSSMLPARTVHTYVSEEGGQIFGFIQIRPRPSRDKWDIIRLVATVDRPADVWARLLEFACVAVGNRGSGKLFANVQDEADELQIFRRIGFYRFSTERSLSLALPGSAPFPPLPPSLRPAEPRDSFALLQLYASIAPRNVQQAEGVTARDWALPNSRLAGLLNRVGLAQDSPQTVWNFVAEEGGRLFGWFRLRRFDGHSRLTFLLRPDKRDRLPHLCTFLIGAARAIQAGGLSVSVREYQQELIPVFAEAGFEDDGCYLLLVKHIAVQVMERRLTPVLTRA